MPPRKKLQLAQPVRRSERIRLREEASEAARISDLGQQDLEQLAEQPRLIRRRKSRAPNGVAPGGGVTRRGRPSRQQNVRVTSTPSNEQPAQDQMALFGRFIDGIFQAARESYAGEFMDSPIPSPNENEQPTQGQRGWVSGQEPNAQDAPVTEELDIIVSMISSDSDMDAI